MMDDDPQVRWEEEESSSWSNKLLVTLIVVLCIIITVEVVYNFWIQPLISVNHIVVHSEVPLEKEDLLQIAGLDGYLNYYSLDEEAVRAKIEAYPGVHDAEVHKIFPDTLEIEILSCRPAAVAFVEGESRTIPLAFDQTGLVFQQDQMVGFLNVPVLSGIQFEGEDFLGLRLPTEFQPLLNSLEEIKGASPLLYNQISEIRINKRIVGGFDCILYLSGHSIPVKVGNVLDEDLIKNILVVLDVLEKSNSIQSGQELDFRTSEIVYSLRED